MITNPADSEAPVNAYAELFYRALKVIGNSSRSYLQQVPTTQEDTHAN
jgi:hypothetical protein